MARERSGSRYSVPDSSPSTISPAWPRPAGRRTCAGRPRRSEDRRAGATIRRRGGLHGWRVALDRPDIDAVIIATPDDTHERSRVAAAAAGKAILLQKPMAGTAAAAAASFVAAAQAGRRPAGELHAPLLRGGRQARGLLDEGVIGRVQSVRVRNATPGPDWGDGSSRKAAVAAASSISSACTASISSGSCSGAIAGGLRVRTADRVPQRTPEGRHAVAVEKVDNAFAIYGSRAAASARTRCR